jgi:hypothetical protein
MDGIVYIVEFRWFQCTILIGCQWLHVFGFLLDLLRDLAREDAKIFSVHQLTHDMKFSVFQRQCQTQLKLYYFGPVFNLLLVVSEWGISSDDCI